MFNVTFDVSPRPGVEVNALLAASDPSFISKVKNVAVYAAVFAIRLFQTRNATSVFSWPESKPLYFIIPATSTRQTVAHPHNVFAMVKAVQISVLLMIICVEPKI